MSLNELQLEVLDGVARGTLAVAVRSLQRRGMLLEVLPEIAQLQGVEQPPQYHAEGDVLIHTLLVLEAAKPTPVQQWAAVLHDIGKPATQEILDGRIRFLGHEAAGAEMAARVLARFEVETALAEQIVRLVRHHMRPHRQHHWKPRALRRFVRRMGSDLDELLDLADADAAGALGPDGRPAKADTQELRRRIRELGPEVAPVVGPPLPLSGHDVMRLLGLPPGPAVGAALSWLRRQPDALDLSFEQAEDRLVHYNEKRKESQLPLPKGRGLCKQAPVDQTANRRSSC